VRKGRTPEEVARQFEPSAQAIRNWVRQADRDAGRRQDGLTIAEQDELRRLRRENRTRRVRISARPLCGWSRRRR
jgi:transposase